MRYNPVYYWLFRGTMGKVLAQRHGHDYARQILKKSDKLYPQLVRQSGDLGRGNPMAYNLLFALVFLSPYLASEKQIHPETVQEMMRQSLYHVRWYFARTDLNTAKGKKANQRSVVQYAKWYTPQRQRRYPGSFQVDFVGKPHPDACYYRITRCPICAYCEKLGCREVMPLLCQLDEVMIAMQHGRLHREQTIASGGAYCDYYITGDREDLVRS